MVPLRGAGDGVYSLMLESRDSFPVAGSVAFHGRHFKCLFQAIRVHVGGVLYEKELGKLYDGFSRFRCIKT
uniref:Uncharacterized protein n=1 Tax=Candidatus Kentrum eta TaxID=2126337 RepID=A0A450UTH4_9GAMM|nr:MAG: hypothetical protein BECKH772A_GA0070896_100931 [Candidatus Kentron sp. H]VFJ97694.1 MAG: hypothetical protein BECKH772B_GA0070898_101171 [Candidatus Kentron sp. H]VFK02937.1 MAG: hypothetical protein BECKH772C_GA0070978_101091 [Candidatus Kentron sp. H]